MGKIILFADRSVDTNAQPQSSFDYSKEYEALDQYNADDASETSPIFVRSR